MSENENQESKEKKPARRRKLYDIIFSRFTTTFAVICLTLSFFLPSDGYAITVCWFKYLFELPCPGCGLTRSITCVSHLEIGKAFHYHPFGPVIYLLMVANAVLLVIPTAKRDSFKNQMSKNDSWLKIVYLTIVFTFLTFGLIRILLISMKIGDFGHV